MFARASFARPAVTFRERRAVFSAVSKEGAPNQVAWESILQYSVGNFQRHQPRKSQIHRILGSSPNALHSLPFLEMSTAFCNILEANSWTVKLLQFPSSQPWEIIRNRSGRGVHHSFSQLGRCPPMIEAKITEDRRRSNMDGSFRCPTSKKQQGSPAFLQCVFAHGLPEIKACLDFFTICILGVFALAH